MKDYVIAADCGTTGSKAVVYDLTGKPIASAYREYGLIFPQAGWVDQDAELLFQTVVAVLGEAFAKANVPASAILSLSLSTQRCTLVAVDGDGVPLRHAISWQDNRTDAQCARIAEVVGPKAYYDQTGLPIANVWALPKIMWLAEHEPDIVHQADKLVLVQAYLNRRFGADGCYDDYSNGSLHGLMSVSDHHWIDDLITATHVPVGKLPELVPSGQRIGALNAAIAAATGLPEGLPLISGGGDQQCAAVGANVIAQGECEVTLGTAGVTICPLDTPNLDPDRIMPCHVHAAPGKWTCEGLQNAAGASLKWLRNLLQEGQPNMDVDYDYMTGLAARSAPGANGLTFLPYLAGAGAPLWDGGARGVLSGLGLQHGLGDVTRAVMEGISFETAAILDNFKRRGITVREVRTSGGGARSALWGQIQADIFGLPVRRLAVDDATILGAAVLAACGAGAFESVEAGADAMVQTREDYQPNASHSDIYGENRARFDALYAAASV